MIALVVDYLLEKPIQVLYPVAYLSSSKAFEQLLHNQIPT